MAVSPSATVTVVGFTVTPATSLSVMETVVSSGLAALTFAGRVPKPSLTDSPPSTALSSVAVIVRVLLVSPLLNVTSGGTPE